MPTITKNDFKREHDLLEAGILLKALLPHHLAEHPDGLKNKTYVESLEKVEKIKIENLEWLNSVLRSLSNNGLLDQANFDDLIRYSNILFSSQVASDCWKRVPERVWKQSVINEILTDAALVRDEPDAHQKFITKFTDYIDRVLVPEANKLMLSDCNKIKEHQFATTTWRNGKKIGTHFQPPNDVEPSEVLGARNTSAAEKSRLNPSPSMKK